MNVLLLMNFTQGLMCLDMSMEKRCPITSCYYGAVDLFEGTQLYLL